MTRNGTPAKLLRRKSDGTTFARIAPPAAFLSHLIVGEDRAGGPAMGPRQDPVNVAVGAYASGSRIATRRLPAGYRTTVVA